MSRDRWNKPKAVRDYPGRFSQPVNGPAGPAEVVPVRSSWANTAACEQQSTAPNSVRGRIDASAATQRDNPNGPVQERPYEEGRYAQMIREEAAAKAKENARIEAERVRIARADEDARRQELLAKAAAVKKRQEEVRAQWAAEALIEAIPFNNLPEVSGRGRV